MENPKPEEIDDLVRRHAQGDRSPELLAALDRAAAFFCGAAQPLKPAEGIHVIMPGRGRMVEDDDEEPVRMHRPLAPSDTLLILARSLDDLGLPVFIGVDGERLLVELPHHPEADCHCLVEFKWIPGKRSVVVLATGDLQFGPSQNARLREICRQWKRIMADPEAVLIRPQDGARHRLQLRSTFFARLALTPDRLVAHLRTLIAEITAFWSFARRGLDRPPQVD